MRKYIRLLSVVLALALLSGCTFNSKNYELVVDNGEYYIRINDDTYFEGVPGGCGFEPELSFQSLKEMVNALKSGSFSEDNLVQLQIIAEHCEGDIPVCDLDDLVEPVLPSGSSVSRVAWSAKRYSFDISDPDMMRWGYLFLLPQTVYDSYIEELLDGDQWKLKCEKITEETDRNATAYYWDTDTDGLTVKELVYSIKDEDGEIYIKEMYYLSSSGNTLESIDIFGISQGKCYRVLVQHLPERPSVEWLSSFGLKEYEG